MTKIIFKILNMYYNIFGIMNTSVISPDEKLSRVFRAVSTPARFRILAAIGSGEACVCHLEALLGLRQAYISQQLMEMRDADLVDTRRDGRYVFYRLTEPRLLDLLIDIGKLLGIPTDEMENMENAGPLPKCACPHCIALKNPSLIHPEEISS
jgi:ArsR family transcriptional regulator